MKPSESLDLGELPREIAAYQQSAVENPQRLRRARTQLLLSARGQAWQRKAARRPLIGWLWAPVAIAVAVSIALVVLRSREASLTFEIASGVSGEVGKPLHATAAGPMLLQFSDGTALSLSPGSKARVRDLQAEGAGVMLEDGALNATVIHRANSRWLVYAGPYRVVVTGTRFDVRWSAPRNSFALDLHEGSVTVFGPSLAESGKRVLPRETLRLGPDAAPPPAAAPVAPAAPAPELPALATSHSGAEPAPVPTAHAAVSASSWKSLALAGKYAEAFSAAEAEGFGNICRRASSGDLLLLGNAARLAKKAAQAEEAFTAARLRPGAAHQHAVAAFQLGRLAQDTRGDHARAASWFETYLAEAPAGPLAREASGRVMEAHHRAGNANAARQAARRYLERYPGGPYETLARKLLSQ